jgi:hypothetical protein
MTNSKMYKVLCPIEDKDGKTTRWARLGSGFTNKDESVNLYLDALPVQAFGGTQIKLQLREYSEEDLRRRDDYRASNGNGRRDTPVFDRTAQGSLGSQGSLESIPF